MDLGVLHTQVFRRASMACRTLAILTAGVIAILQLSEIYNTTIFATGRSHTAATEVGSAIRFGLSPMVDVIWINLIVLTITFSVVCVVFRERETVRTTAIKR